MATTNQTTNSVDVALLAFVRKDNSEIKASLGRLYRSGDIGSEELASCVGRIIDLADYNDLVNEEWK